MRNVFFPLLFLSMAACNGQSANTAKITPDDFEKGISTPDVQVLDVRTAAEFRTGHIKNALQADWTNQQQFADRIQYVDKDKPVYIYCLVGGRSASAASWMRSNGYKKVIELDGGINAWKRASKPLEDVIAEKQMTLEEYKTSIPADKTVLVDFGATWCPPCVKMAPVLEELEKNKDLDFLLIKVDAGVHTDLMKALNIEPIPVFIVYKNGKETWRKQGIVSKEELVAQLK
ncbi:MAG: rhodanese-like domain-containing protein [Chitinophagaceae bacterium]